MHLDFDVLKSFDCRVCGCATPEVGDRNSVQRVAIAAAWATAEREQRGVGLILLPVELSIAGGNDCRHRYPDHECVAPWGRQRL